MKVEDLKTLVQDIVKQATELKDKHTWAKDAPVNYVAIFNQDEEGYNNLLSVVKEMGYIKIAEDTPTGQVFHIKPLDTVSGKLNLLKIRKPDTTKPEMGDADFTVADYPKFKKYYLVKRKWFKLIEREDFEMIELMDPEFNVRAYFSNPPTDKRLGIK